MGTKNYNGLNTTLIYNLKKKIWELSYRLKFEEDVSALASKFAGIFDMDKAINDSLKELGKMSNASRAYIFLLHEDGKMMSNAYEWCAEGVSRQKKNLQNIPIKMFPWWMKKLNRNEVINIEDISKLSSEADPERKILQRQGIKAILVFPLYAGKKLEGFIGFDNVKSAEKWEEDNLVLLKTVSEIIGNAFERKKAENELKASEEKYKNLFENANDAIFIADPVTGILLDANRQAEKLLGRKREEIRGLHQSKLHSPEKTEYYTSKFKQHVKSGRLTDMYAEVVRKDKTIVPVAISTSVIKIGGKTVIQGIFKDMTEIKKAEEELKKSEEKFRAFFENSADGIAIADVKLKKFVDVNDQFCRYSGYSKEELLKKGVYSIHPKKDLPYVLNEFRKQVKGKKGVIAKNMPILRKDGKVVYSDINSAAITLGGRPCLMGFFRDVTQKKENEEKLNLKIKEPERKIKNIKRK